MNKFNWRWVVALACIGWLGSPQVSFGLGLGLPVTRAVLGDALKVSVPVRLENGEELADDCVKAEVFFGEDKLPASLVNARIVRAQQGAFQSGAVSVQVQTVSLVNEPVVTVSMTVGCSSRITRRFVTLVDPPAVAIPQVAPAPAQPSDVIVASEVRAALRPDATGSVVDPSSAHRSPLGRQAPSFKLSGPPAVSSAGSVRDQKRAAEKNQLKSKTGTAAPRLVLDPVAMETQVMPGLQMSQGLAVVPTPEASAELEQKRRAAAAVWMAMNATPEETARDRQRLEDVEQRLSKLTQDSEKASQALNRVQEQIGHRGASGDTLLYVLAFAVAGLIVYIVWRERAMRDMQRAHQYWLASQMAQDMEQDAGDRQSDLNAEVVEPALGDVVVPEASMDTKDGGEPLAVVDVLLPTVPGALPDDPKTSVSPLAIARDVSVDELIDLDQQVEFFMVLGQEESAIDVLESYIRVSGASTPMPFLKLLELYRHAGLRADYERTRMNFNLQFNAHAPLWEANPEHGHALEDYPGVIERIQALWRQPLKAMGVIERSLMRQDAESYTFDLPAYRELFLLYLVLKDLLAHPESISAANGSGADERDAHFDIELDSSTQPLMATLPMKTLPELAPVLSLDLELGEHGLVLPPAEDEPSSPNDPHKP